MIKTENTKDGNKSKGGRKENLFTGIITAAVTPLRAGVIDFHSFDRLLDMQIAAGIKAVVIGGSTGEGNSLDAEEYYSLLKHAVESRGEEIKIIAGVSEVSTAAAVKKALGAEKCGAAGLMCTAPMYVRPGAQGIYLHFKAIHDATKLPIMLYDHPGRTGVSITDATVLELAKLERITALKDGGNDVARPIRIADKLMDFNLLSGNDENILSYNVNGGRGCVSVLSNIMPEISLEIMRAAVEGDFLGALEKQREVAPLFLELFAETNPVGIKYALSLKGLCLEEVRLPLTEASLKNKESLKSALFRLKII